MLQQRTLMLAREVQFMMRMRSPYLLLFLGVWLSPLACVTEYMARGSLHDLLQAAAQDPLLMQQLSWEQRLKMALHAALGLHHLHSGGILHRDLNTRNLLVDDALHVKMANFGMAEAVGAAEAGEAPGQECIAALTQRIDRRWMAPEVATALSADACPPQPFTKAADVWSFGMVLWELATWRQPYPGLTDAQASRVAIYAPPCPPPMN